MLILMQKSFQFCTPLVPQLENSTTRIAILNIVLLAWFCSTQQRRQYIVNDSSGLIHFLMCFFLCPATESDRMSESGGYLRFDNFFNYLHFNGNHHQLKTYGEFLRFLEKSGDLPEKTNCVQIHISIIHCFCFILIAAKVKIII